MIKIHRYNAQLEKLWDDFVLKTKSPTLLHQRTYMDYHANRFKDASLLLTDEHNRIISLLPACWSNKQTDSIISHEGLTYGGYLFAPQTHTNLMEEAIERSLQFYKEELKVNSLILKPIPYIYNTQANDEQLYIIHRLGGQIQERNLSQAINLAMPMKWSELRRRSLLKAHKNALHIAKSEDREEWNRFHRLLSQMLSEHHNTRPVHSAEELWMLHTRFPDSIQLYTAHKERQLLAGAIIYLSPTVAHTQYLATSSEGRQCGALDFVISRVLTQESIQRRRWFDFGISTERDGSLNHGLTLQKEGFGGRGVCYDTYKITL